MNYSDKKMESKDNGLLNWPGGQRGKAAPTSSPANNKWMTCWKAWL